jgi:hypothetical protein
MHALPDSSTRTLILIRTSSYLQPTCHTLQYPDSPPHTQLPPNNITLTHQLATKTIFLPKPKPIYIRSMYENKMSHVIFNPLYILQKFTLNVPQIFQPPPTKYTIFSTKMHMYIEIPWLKAWSPNISSLSYLKMTAWDTVETSHSVS